MVPNDLALKLMLIGSPGAIADRAGVLAGLAVDSCACPNLHWKLKTSKYILETICRKRRWAGYLPARLPRGEDARPGLSYPLAVPACLTPHTTRARLAAPDRIGEPIQSVAVTAPARQGDRAAQGHRRLGGPGHKLTA